MLLAAGPRGTQERRGIGCAFQHTGSLQVTDANAYLIRGSRGLGVSQGMYGVRTEAINFRGKLQLSSTLSQTTTGTQSAVLRVLKPFFKDDSTEKR